MKKLILCALMLMTVFSFAQTTNKTNTVNNTSYIYTTANRRDLQKLNVKEMMKQFKDNDPNQIVSIKFQLIDHNTLKPKGYSWKGKTSDLEKMLPTFEKQIKNL